ncbi:MAG: fasciclin domain-containing protein [Planctomycetia bacterium]
MRHLLAASVATLFALVSPVVAADKDIVDTAVASGSFKTLAIALTAADLIDTLKSEGPFTVFAPTDEAFAAVPKATLEALLADKAKLKKVLLYHVVKGEVPSSKVVDLKEAVTAGGPKVVITIENGKVMINEAKVVKADVKASNGVIHVIDKVLMPPSE